MQRHHAFTLIELLAVISIMAILSAAFLGSLPTGDTQASPLQQIYQFDQSLRHAARQYGKITVTMHGLRLRATTDNSNKETHNNSHSSDSDTAHNYSKELILEPGTRFHNSNDRPLQTWVYDRFGCSIDFRIIWPQGSQSVAGLSGALVADDDLLMKLK